MATSVLTIAWAGSALAANETYTDEQFSDGDWSSLELLDETSDDSALITGARSDVGGNPDAHRGLAISWTHDGVGDVTVIGGHMHAHFEHRPVSSGEIGSVELVFDIITNGTTYPAALDETAMAFYPVLQQSGAYYIPAVGAVSSDSWSRLSSGQLLDGHFARYAGDPLAPSHPNFSNQGSAINFGFAVAVGPHGLPGSFTTEGGVDNFTVFVRDPGEPSDGGVGGAGGAGGGSSSGSGSGSDEFGVGNAPGRESDGCGCRTAGTAKERWPIPAWLALLALGLSAHRRRQAR